MVSAPPLSPPAGESTATLAADQKRVDESLRTCATSLRACEMTVPPATVPADSVSAGTAQHRVSCARGVVRVVLTAPAACVQYCLPSAMASRLFKTR